MFAYVEPQPAAPLEPHKEQRSVRGVERWTVYLLADGRCAYCDKAIDFEDMEVDHRDPWARGGLHCWCNWACACAPCNRRKGDMPYARWMADREYQRKLAAWRADPVARARDAALFKAAHRRHHEWLAGTVQGCLFEAA